MTAPEYADNLPKSSTLADIDDGQVRLRTLARLWAAYTLMVFAGSAWYGASVAYALGLSTIGRGALWLILTTGLSWCVFGPVLMAATRKGALTCAHACLVTMTAGIGVLAVGGIINFALGGRLPAIDFNWAWVALSNVVMAAVLIRQFRSIGAPWLPVLIAWIAGLDGAGGLMFVAFRHLI